MPAGDGLPPSHYNIWMSALCQSLTTLVADFVSLATDWKYHSLDYFSHWVTDMRKFLVYILIIVTLGASRSVMQAHWLPPPKASVIPCAHSASVVVPLQVVRGAAPALLPNRDKRARHSVVLL